MIFSISYSNISKINRFLVLENNLSKKIKKKEITIITNLF
jgi:hypothetical protein